MKNLAVFAVILAAFAWGALATVANAAEPDLLQAISSGDEEARLLAIDTLGRQGNKIEGAVPALIEQLASESAPVRAHAADALGRIGPAAKPAAEALAKLIGDEDPQVRRQAVQAYTNIRPGPEVSIPLFNKLFAEAEPEVRIHIMGAMAEAGKAAVPGLTTALEHEEAAYWACLVLAEIGPDAKPAVPALVKLIETHQQPEVCREAILALAGIGEEAAAAVPALIGVLDKDKERINAGPVLFALGSIGLKAKAAEAKIRQLADDPDSPPMLQTVGLWALARMNPKDEELAREVLPRLIDALKSPDGVIRDAAAQALLDLDPDPAIARPLIKKAMEEAGPEVLDDILDAMASLGEKAVPRLIAVLEEATGLRAKAAAIIARIGPPAKEVVPALMAALKDEDPQTRCEVLFALAAIGPDAAAAVPAVVEVLGDAEANVCYAACFALGKLGPAALPAKAKLHECLAADDPFTCMSSAWALAQIDPMCEETAEKSVPVLIQALADPDPLTRTHAAEALRCLGPLAAMAVDALTKAQQDESGIVRDAAAEAIKAIGTAAPPAARTETTTLGPGSKAVTVEDDVQLRLGPDEVVARLPKGSQLEVVQVKGSWLGVRVEVDGQTMIGWVDPKQVGQP